MDTASEVMRSRKATSVPGEEVGPNQPDICILNGVLFKSGLRRIAIATAFLPLFTLSACFLYSMIFDYSTVNVTICKVFNILPSLSAVTGVFPQCYVWRMGVALYCCPQILLASALPSYYRTKKTNSIAYSRVVTISGATHILECIFLVGVAFISNKDSYPVHMKLFCTFMFNYVSHLLSTCWVVTRYEPETADEIKSRKYKIRIAKTSMASSIGMAIAFYLHRTRCVVMAFSVFSFCEYVLGTCNVLFHLTIIYDLPSTDIYISFDNPRTTSVRKDRKTD